MSLSSEADRRFVFYSDKFSLPLSEFVAIKKKKKNSKLYGSELHLM